MFDPPFDAPPVLLALALVAATTVGAATTLAPTAPTDASRLAAAVDRTATSPVSTATTVETTALAVRITPNRIETRRDGRRSSSPIVTGPITPVAPGTRLARVLHGADHTAVFASPVDLELATRRARARPTDWRHDPAHLVVRHLTWGNTSVTLVGV